MKLSFTTFVFSVTIMEIFIVPQYAYAAANLRGTENDVFETSDESNDNVFDDQQQKVLEQADKHARKLRKGGGKGKGGKKIEVNGNFGTTLNGFTSLTDLGVAPTTTCLCDTAAINGFFAGDIVGIVPVEAATTRFHWNDTCANFQAGIPASDSFIVSIIFNGYIDGEVAVVDITYSGFKAVSGDIVGKMVFEGPFIGELDIKAFNFDGGTYQGELTKIV